MKLPQLASTNTLYAKNACNHSTTLCFTVCFSLPVDVSSIPLSSNSVIELGFFLWRGTSTPGLSLRSVNKKIFSKMSSTTSDFCQYQCLWQIFWKMSALSFTSYSWTSSSKVQVGLFILCTLPSIMGSCFLSSSQALPTSGVSDSCCAPRPTLDLRLHPLVITSASASLSCLLCQMWRKGKSVGAVVKFW